MKTLLVVLISAFSLFGQTDWQKWGKADFHYSKENHQTRHTLSATVDTQTRSNIDSASQNGQANINPTRNENEGKGNSSGSKEDSFGETLLKSAVKVYWVTFSDVDGDNWPFTPTCSSFLLQSVKETNVFQGTLMFFDRFTRDTNTFERLQHYPVIKNEHFYDPVTLYTLNENKTRRTLRELYQQKEK